MKGIVLLGLGPGGVEKLTREAWEVINNSEHIWVRTNLHPVIKDLPSSLEIHSFDDYYENGESIETVYSSIVEKVLALGTSQDGIIYAVPGDPFVAEATCPEIARRAGLAGIPVRIINGLSFLEPVFSALEIDPFDQLTLLDGIELSQKHIPPFPPDIPVLIAQIHSRLVAAEIKMTLNSVYPDDHSVRMIHAAGTSEELIENLQLYKIDRSRSIGLLTALYVPPLAPKTSFESFQEVVAGLRAPEGCPWDREQTHASLRPHLMEEAYEAIAAMDSGDPSAMMEELGDLLLQIVLNAQIASEEGEFNMSDVLKRINKKIINRHPHVFGDLKLEGVDGVLKNWEKLKELEREDSKEPGKGLLDGVPLALPALAQAQEFQERAARVGFDWQDAGGVLEKIQEEIGEINTSSNASEFSNELGDLFFALVNFARWKKLEAESVLREANKRFKERFSQVEIGAINQGKKLSDLSLDEMEALWQSAKKR